MTRRDAVAVGWLLGASALIGAAIYYASPAKADQQDVEAYAAINGPAICSTLDSYPSLSGLHGVTNFVIGDGPFTDFEAGEVIGSAIFGFCPNHIALLGEYTNSYYEPVLTA